MVVTFINPAVVDAGANQVACTNSSTLALNGNVSGITNTGIWTGNGTGLFLPGSASPNATYQLSAGDILLPQITLTLTSTGSGNLCAEVSKTMAITIIEKPVVSVPNTFTVCGNAVIITLTGTVTGAASIGNWSSPDGSGSFNQSPLASAIYTMGTADILAGGVNFVLSSTGGFCPSESSTFSVAILDAPVVIVNENNSVVCKNAPIALTGTVTGYTTSGQWSTSGTGDFSPDNTSLGGQYIPSAGDVANGSVIITLSSTQNSGCPATTDAFQAFFIPAPVAEYNIALKRCKDEGVQFTNASQANGTSSLSYVWDFGDASGVSIALDPLHTFTTVGSYVISMTVTGTSSLGVSCPDTVAKRVFINPIPTANYDFLNGCKNLATQFRDSSSVFGGSIVGWSWQFGDNSVPGTIKNPIHTYTNSGTYSALLTVTSNNGCSAFISKLVNINPSPQAEFGLTNNPAVAQEPIYFSDFSTPTSAIQGWYWEFGDEGTSDIQAPSHSYQLAGIYNVTLTVTDDAGCRDTIAKTIEITLLPQVPTAFTPNGDGNNDLLFIKGGPFQRLTFKVYNSWGELLFETTDQSIGWDGKKNGVDQPLGSYVWTLVVDMYNNRQIKKNGDVSIIR
jgi:gliding motility-associated-like protein